MGYSVNYSQEYLGKKQIYHYDKIDRKRKACSCVRPRIHLIISNHKIDYKTLVFNSMKKNFIILSCVLSLEGFYMRMTNCVYREKK